MGLLLDSFWRAVAYCLHPRVIALSFLPLGLGTLAGKWSGQPTMIVSRASFGHVGNILPAMAAYKNFPGMEGATYYYFGIPKNPVNEAMVAAHYKEFKTPPDFFTAGGFSSAMALVTALKATNGDTNTNKLIKTMEGMSFETPKGKMTFRKEDHQAMQSMYHFKIKKEQKNEWDLLELVREIPMADIPVPVKNKR